MWVAAIQLTATADMEGNIARAQELVKEAVHHGASLVALPENFAYMGPEDQPNPAAQPLDGPLVREFQALARSLGIYYRKIHLFDVEVTGGPVFRESRYIQAGSEVSAVSLAPTLFTVGLSICYDLRFPELYRALTDRGADLIFIPATFTLATGRDHWEVLVRARAIENQAYVVAASPACAGRCPVFCTGACGKGQEEQGSLSPSLEGGAVSLPGPAQKKRED